MSGFHNIEVEKKTALSDSALKVYNVCNSERSIVEIVKCMYAISLRWPTEPWIYRALYNAINEDNSQRPEGKLEYVQNETRELVEV